MFTSDAVTRGIRVHVESEYAPERSQPGQNRWFFLYTITITNEGSDTAQLVFENLQRSHQASRR